MTTSYIPYRLDGKVALVTGSGRGIGAAIAIQLARLGAKVVVNYANSVEHAEKVVAEIKNLNSDAIALRADVRDVSQTAKLFDDAVAHFGHLDIAVSNSGVVSFGHLKDVTEEEFDRVFSLNTRGQFFVAREAYRVLQEGGRIVLTSSNTSKDFSVPKHSLYSASKGAIDTFVRILSKDCGDKKITVNGVAPGGTVCTETTRIQWVPTRHHCTEMASLRILLALLDLLLVRKENGSMAKLSLWMVVLHELAFRSTICSLDLDIHVIP